MLVTQQWESWLEHDDARAWGDADKRRSHHHHRPANRSLRDEDYGLLSG